MILVLVCSRTVSGQDRFILHASADQIAAIASRHGLTPAGVSDTPNVGLVKNASDARTPDAVVAELMSDPDVQNFEIDRAVSVLESGSAPGTPGLPEDLAESNIVSYFGTQVWSAYVNQAAAALTRLADAQKLTGSPATGAGVIALIDTGVDPTHPVLQGALLPGYDFVSGTAGTASDWSDLDPSTAGILGQAAGSSAGQGNVLLGVNQSTAVILDQSTAVILDTSHLPAAFGHGTMVAGIIHLVAPTARIMPLRAFKADGTGILSNVVQAIYYATDNGVQIINMSFSLSNPSIELMKAVNYATAHGVVCVASAGNTGIETIAYPAAFRNVIGVASTNAVDVRSSFSSFGPALTQLAAPGENVVTVYPGGYYALVSGTSFAAPFVSGAGSLILQVDGDLDPSEVFGALAKARKLTPDLGFGRLDLYATLKSLLPQ